MARRPQIKTQLVGYYTTAEAALYLRCSAFMTWKWASNGKLPAINVNGHYFIPEADLRAFVKPGRGNPLIGLASKAYWESIRKVKRAQKRAENSRKRRKLACYPEA